MIRVEIMSSASSVGSIQLRKCSKETSGVSSRLPKVERLEEGQADSDINCPEGIYCSSGYIKGGRVTSQRERARENERG